MIAYNLMALFRTFVLREKTKTKNTTTKLVNITKRILGLSNGLLMRKAFSFDILDKIELISKYRVKAFVKLLPKPGVWMETLKEVLAFPLLLTVVYIVQIVNPDYRIATLILLIAVWFACWIIGRVPPYSEGKQIRKAWGIGLSMVALSALIGFMYFGPVKHYLPWEPYNEAQLAEYRREGKTVMVEFTARWCFNCQTNMRFAIDREKVKEVVDQNRVITMLADKSDPSPAINKKLQELGCNSIPLLAIYPPNGEPILLEAIITESQLIGALERAGPSRVDGESVARPVSTSVH